MSRAFRLGLFIVATLLIFAGGVYWIGNKQFLFTSTYRLNADFQTVAGLSGGAEVRVGGIDLRFKPGRDGGEEEVAKRETLATSGEAATQSRGPGPVIPHHFETAYAPQ